MSLSQIPEMLRKGTVDSFTLEPGRGETYADGLPTLYGHGEYERSSVLAGRPRRVFIDKWKTWEEARKAIDEFQKDCPGFIAAFEDHGKNGASTHVPVEQMVAHLPDDEDDGADFYDDFIGYDGDEGFFDGDY